MGDRNPDKVMSILDHLIELRGRFIVSIAAFLICFVLTLIFFPMISGLFTAQFVQIENTFGATLFANSIAEGFLVQVQASAIIGIIVSLPFHLVNGAQFFLPAFPERSRRFVTAGLIASFLLAIVGAFIAYFQIIPFSIRFLIDSAYIPEDVAVLLNYHKSISYILTFILWAIITFQAPLILVILLALNILNRSSVLRSSRYVIILIFLAAAIMTPSVDPISQVAIAMPLIVLYFSALLFARIFKLGEGVAKKDGVT